MADEDEDYSRRNSENEKNKSEFIIRIPSYQEVFQTSQSRPQSDSLFNPSPSFSQAFNFIKQSEFYTPPPPPSSTLHPQTDIGSDSRDVGKPNFPSSSSVGPSSSSFSQSVQNRNAILVNNRQKGNPLLKYIRNVRWAFADDVVCDYMLGQNACALYLSLRYHLLHPDYLYFRIRELQKNFRLRVVLCHVDVEDVLKPLLEVTKTALLHDCTLLCGWSLEECGRYLETIKVYENKPADLIQGQTDTDYLSRLNHALTGVRHVNKTDVVTLGSTFGSLSHVMDASMEDLARCPGIGERKVKRLYDTFHEPFKHSVPRHNIVAEDSTRSSAGESCLVSQDRKEGEVEETKKGSKNKKEERLKPAEGSVKSALSAAFAKYSAKKTTQQKGD
ncbi:DNA excision repair protein ERCC-1 [Impatiens glandulifera]|uniref:DNA excision repair protein ERCC-1 n=1 Tax=Impatiens glandulifera TaxID=253017 RepID=UPI001FB1142B|nr:DNA excision repair protein ERCC-1 [Impatiens glandulifera]